MNVPAGVTDGQRIRLAGQGGRGTEGAANGDLYLIVRIAPHPRYRLDGRDLYADLLLAPWEAALGTSVALDTPGGEAKVKVPSGTSTGARLRLRGRGLPNPRGKPGDLFAEAKIMVPARPSRAERRLFEQLAAESNFDPRRQPMNHAMVRAPAPRLTLDEFAMAAGLHPDLIRGWSPSASSRPATAPRASCGSPVASWPWWPGCSGFARAWGSTTRPSRW